MHGLSTEQFPVSAYVGSLKNLKDLKNGQWSRDSGHLSATRRFHIFHTMPAPNDVQTSTDNAKTGSMTMHHEGPGQVLQTPHALHWISALLHWLSALLFRCNQSSRLTPTHQLPLKGFGGFGMLTARLFESFRFFELPT